MKKPIIELNQFSFQYHSQAEPTLKNLNLTIYEGEKILVIGPSGSGKSTFAHCMNGLIPNQYEGEITGDCRIYGKSIKDQSLFDLSFQTGTVLQDTDGQFIGLTVAEDIAFLLENDAVSSENMKEEVTKWAELVAIAGHLSKRPQELSGGQKQRASMAGVLINEAPILLFDEPLANLDPNAGKEAVHLIDKIHQETQTTILMIEHRLEDVLECAIDRILVFNEGEIVADETPETLLRRDLLQTIGIREPLYVTALKEAGVDLTQVSNLANIHQVAGTSLNKAMMTWQKSVSLPTARPKEKTPLLTLKELTYRYKKQDPLVLDHLSTTIHRGEIISIVGQNGAGKSTLFKAICGFIPAQGDLIWEGSNLAKASIKERADKIGYVLQNPNQMISQKMIFDEVALGLRLRGVSEAEIKERVAQTLTICGLYPFRHWPIAALSYGQKKRVTIAAILVLEPEMIILDEPTAGQDYARYTEMMQFLEKLNQMGKTIVMITHDMHLMLEYSQRTLVINRGQLIADQSPLKVLTTPELIAEASLKETSLFTFAKQIGLNAPVAFTKTYLAVEKARGRR
ncbi:ABC transporter ATP-binding protein [Enterococcus lemanii]|uniref:ABC transporter ATP-binding protein n=1 Tax=Enterococcus lemanii TaxID=1159752 RepID=A0ABV9MXA2_9ENTE|nr:ABC transporter ATP-binding protein [Enterococcus lemanii]MBM7710195.1 energy-coupling factor transport system ATP-binding protein [Enterococcus lemanii]